MHTMRKLHAQGIEGPVCHAPRHSSTRSTLTTLDCPCSWLGTRFAKTVPARNERDWVAHDRKTHHARDGRLEGLISAKQFVNCATELSLLAVHSALLGFNQPLHLAINLSLDVSDASLMLRHQLPLCVLCLRYLGLVCCVLVAPLRLLSRLIHAKTGFL